MNKRLDELTKKRAADERFLSHREEQELLGLQAAEIERLLPISERPSYEEYYDALNWRGLVTLELRLVTLEMTGPEPLEISVGQALELIRMLKEKQT